MEHQDNHNPNLTAFVHPNPATQQRRDDYQRPHGGDKIGCVDRTVRRVTPGVL